MRRVAPLAAALGLSACVLGPRQPVPPVPLPPAAAPARLAPASGPAQRVAPGEAPAADWWRAFGNPDLDALVARALAADTDLAAAEATLRQAREQAAAAAGQSLPQLDASYQGQRQRVSRTFSNPIQDPSQYLYSLHTAQATVSYPLDVFGAARSRTRSARAQADVAAARLDAARTTLIANLVVAVVTRASLLDQIDAAAAAVASNREILTLLVARERLGEIGAADVAAQQTALATSEGALPPLRRAATHEDGLIATMTGLPAGAPLPPLPRLAQLTLPDRLPVALPAALVAQRPDVRAAEAQLHGAAADVGSAIAARLPGLVLSASVGGTATRFADMFASGNPFWTLIGGVTQPLFHGGQLRHQQRAAEAALDAAKAQYRGTALQAFADVEDALAALRTDAEALDAATRAADAADRNLLFVRRQLQLGAAGTLALLNATAAQAQAASQLIQARAARLSDSALLVQAVGAPGPVAAPAG